MTICLCTLAIHPAYRRRAQRLCADAKKVPWLILTDEPDDFAKLPVRALKHVPTGPMAADYLDHLSPTGEQRGAAAYHDKRFAIRAALEDFDTAIFIDADCRIRSFRAPKVFPHGLAVLPVVQKTVGAHLESCGAWRLPVFAEFARELPGGVDILDDAQWGHEALMAITKDGREARFFEAWSRAADFLQARGVYSGEGGVIGIAAAYAGWSVDHSVLTEMARSIEHEGGGPKIAN
jgi:hypothetical protein